MNIDNIIVEIINKVLKSFIKENTYKVPLNEYLDKYFGSNLKKYLKMSDEEKQNLRLHDTCYLFIEWFNNYIEENEIEIDNETMAKIESACEDYDWNSVKEILDFEFGERESQDITTQFLNSYNGYNYYEQPKTYDVMDYNKTIKNEWLVHFSDNAWEISKEGFQYATYDMDDLGYSNAGSTKGKGSEGFDFAFLASRVSNWNCGKYGDEAVLFRASGVEAYHYGDDEQQVMFYNKEAKDIIYLQHDRECDEWYVDSRINGNVLYKTDDISDLITWVIENLPQYRKHLLYNKESKVRRDNYKNSEYNYKRQFK